MRTLFKWMAGAGFAVMLLLIWSCQKDPIRPTVACTVSAPSPDEHPKAAIYRSIIDQYTAGGLPGIAILIRDDGGVWYGASGMADIDRQIPMQPCH
ncbi:MAG TPA: hypothetical protein PKE06_26950, partial [Flavilitoribacter sp.]|nr:hypothetical protein [Flavilitoribacter sp.]